MIDQFLVFLTQVHDHVKNISKSTFMSSILKKSYYMGKDTEWFEHL